jgi:hypothetical protein
MEKEKQRRQPRKRWRDDVEEDLNEMVVTQRKALRWEGRKIVSEANAHNGL